MTSRTDLTIRSYQHQDPPADPGAVPLWVNEELRRLEHVIRDLVEAAPQVVDVAPKNPRKGTIRYALAPWNPLGTGNAWVYWTGSAWAVL